MSLNKHPSAFPPLSCLGESGTENTLQLYRQASFLLCSVIKMQPLSSNQKQAGETATAPGDGRAGREI